MYPRSNQTLVHRLEASSTAVIERVREELGRLPPWADRAFMEKSGLQHLSYLGHALLADDVLLMARYARWQQSVLVGRGLCTLHLAEHFERLGRAISDVVMESGQAMEFLGAAVAALRYEATAARAIQDASEVLSERAAQELGARFLDELRYHLAYLSDAMAVKKPALFAGYLARLTGSFERGQLQAALLVLRQVIADAGELSADQRSAAEAVLRAALDPPGRAAGTRR